MEERMATTRDSETLDMRQDDLMAIESVDGRPPTHEQRRTGWRWIAIAVPVLVVVAATVAMIRGMSLGAVIGYGIAAMALWVLGSWPVWAASLRRGKEESVAREEAHAEPQPKPREI